MDFVDGDSAVKVSVQERRMKWVLTTDKAFAEELQTKEFREHYKHNKEKNAQLREDLSRAKTVAREIEEGTAKQIEKDREIAKKLSEELSKYEISDNLDFVERFMQEKFDGELVGNLLEKRE